MRYLRLLVQFLKANLLVELEYRANFLVQSVMGVFWAGIGFLSVALFYSHTDQLGGWSYAQAMVIVALFTLTNSVIHGLLQPNIKRIVEMVRDGTMDFVLIKPVNSQFISTLRYARYSGLADLVTGTAILIYAFDQMHYTPSAGSMAQFALMFGLAMLIVYSIWLAIGATSFWFVKIDNMAELFNVLFDTARFPVSTFSGLVRALLTFVLPVAFITTFPAEAVLGQLNSLTLVGTLLMSVLFFVLSTAFWRKAVRNYSSASS